MKSFNNLLINIVAIFILGFFGFTFGRFLGYSADLAIRDNKKSEMDHERYLYLLYKRIHKSDISLEDFKQARDNGMIQSNYPNH